MPRTGMEVFVSNLPASFTERELHRLFAHFGDRSRFRIVRCRDVHGRRHRFGLGVIHPARSARRAIRRLDGRTVDGHRIRVRPFVRRTASRERRRVDWRRVLWPHHERRRTERRRSPLLTHPHPRFESEAAERRPRPNLVCIRGARA